MAPAIDRSSAAAAGGVPAWRRRAVEIGAAVVLALGALGGLVLWAEWGFLVAFDAVVTYCFG
jgi:hypothetical protein